MPTFYIVRHGNTFDPGEPARRIGRRTDLPLSVSGRQQANALGEYFSANNIAFCKVYSAPLKRTRETADAIAARAPNPVEVIIEPLLTEIDYGPDENQTEDKVIARIGEATLSDWNANSVPPPGWDADPDALAAAWRSLFARVAGLAPTATTIAVTSNGVARFALDAADCADDRFPKKLRTGAFGRVEIANGQAVVSAWDIRP